MKILKIVLPLVILGAIAAAGIGNFSDLLFGPMTPETAAKKLPGMLKDIDWAETHVTSRAKLSGARKADLKDTLPDIKEFPLVVNPTAGNAVIVEIFSSSEKSGKGTDGWLVEATEAFNRSSVRSKDGKPIRVRIRKIASGTGFQFIASDKYRPQGFTPSNHLWIRMAEAHGVKMTPVTERLVGNVAGIVMRDEVAESIESQYGNITIPSLIDAVVQGNVAMGYTNPFASSTGLNFLVTVLSKFADGNPGAMLSTDVVSAFASFQAGVPFVGQTTLQLRESVENEGALDAFVMEYQTYIKTEVLADGYRFIPFGIRHDNPLYAVGDLPEAQMEALHKFGKFLTAKKWTKKANDYGFNANLGYTPKLATTDGELLVKAQRLWKEQKDAGRPVVAVFLADVSGSMRGERLRALKSALTAGTQFITPQNSIGLVVFNNAVRVLLPIKRFNLVHKATFQAAVQSIQAGGNTAMYDGVLVSLSMLLKAMESNPDAKPILFVLTDGKTNKGFDFGKTSELIQGLAIPVYTIGYAAKIDELKRLSSLVEAASINAGEGQIEYKIGSLLNAQM